MMTTFRDKLNNWISRYIKYLLLGLIIYFPVFGHIDSLPIRIWDEARLAMNAYEMVGDHDYIVTHFEGEPDMWNTKPPMMIWAQVICMKLFGVNELSVRLPSAISAFLVCVVILLLSTQYLKNFWLGFIAILVLVTSHGFIDFHASRTGDYDSMLTFFTTAGCLLIFAYVEKQKTWILYLFFISLAFGVLTKGVAGLLFLPAIAIYIFYRKQFVPLIKNKHFYFGLLGCLALIAGYYLIRESQNPGYIAIVGKNEWGGRFLDTIENHQHGFWFYYQNFIDVQLPLWHYLIPCGIAMGLLSKNEKIKKLTLFSLLVSTSYFLIISSAQTKIKWYDMPLYPYLAIFIAIFIHSIFEAFKNAHWAVEKLRFNAVPFIFLFLVGIWPYQQILLKTNTAKEYPDEYRFYEIGHYLKGAVKGHYDVDGQFLVYQGYNTHNQFYLTILNDKGISISFKEWDKLVPNDEIIVSQDNVDQYIREHYEVLEIFKHGGVVTYRIVAKLQPED